jgi:hypothetical protein
VATTGGWDRFDRPSQRRRVALMSEALVGTDEFLWESERTRIVRRFLPSGSVIVKSALGPAAAARTRHEKAMLERLAGVPGVAKLVAGTSVTNELALHDVPGVTLTQAMSEAPFALPELLEFALRCAQTLGQIHSAGIVHRDINPANILLVEPSRRPTFIDFHISSSSAEERPAFTAQGEIQGTLAYMAPEQTGRTGRVLDHRADLYALGATLYELSTGRTPFAGGDFFEVMRDILLRIPIAPALLDPRIPPAFSDIVMLLLAKEPDQRYQSAQGLAADLDELIGRRDRGETGAFVLRAYDFPQRLSPPSRLIGRGLEVAVLREAFEEALAGGRRGLLIAGAPGVGKTALINELRTMVTARGGWFVTGKFDRTRQDLDADAVTQAFRKLFRLLLAEPEEELALLRERLVRALGPNLALAVAIMPELGLLLGVVPEPVAGDSLAERGRLAQLSLDLIRTIAASRPIVFVVDDIQWAGATPLGFIDAILSDTTLAGVLLVGAYRVADIDAVHPLAPLLSRWERLAAPPRRLLLENLGPSDLSLLLGEMLRLGPSDASRLAAAVATSTDGNPYDTTELIHTLRCDGVLTQSPSGWTWEEAAIRRYVGAGGVVELLAARIEALPPESAALLETMACLGGDVGTSLLAAAAGCSASELERRLTPIFDQGLAVLERDNEPAVRFRHDRVQQAAYSRLVGAARLARHHALARRLAKIAAYAGIAAEQYLPALELVRDTDERLRCVALFRSAATARLIINDAAVHRLLTAAMALIDALPEHCGAPAAELETELHAALYRLGRLEEADAVYRSIARRERDALDVIDAACVQISSLTNRNLLQDALSLGLDFLHRIGRESPPREGLGTSIEQRLNAIYEWSDDEHARNLDLNGPEAVDPRATGAAKLINRLMPPAYFCDHSILAWLVLESLDLWSAHGPQAQLVGPVSHAGFVTVALKDDYQIGYRVTRRLLRVSEARGYEPQTSQARFLFSLGTEHWFEPFADCVVQAQLAHEGLIRGGDLQQACHTYYASIPLMLQSAPSFDDYAAHVEAGIALSIRTGNEQSVSSFAPHRQLVRLLRGDVVAEGSLTDESCDEVESLPAQAKNPTEAVYFHLMGALGAYLFDQPTALLRHMDAAMPLLPHIIANPATAIAHLLRGVALARRVADTESAERLVLLTELDRSLEWLRLRAADAPANFSHMARLVEAERAWAVADFRAAGAAFEAAQRDATACTSPRHAALIAERAGRFYLEAGLERYARLLIGDACRLYDDWGASAKVRGLEAAFPFLLDARPRAANGAATTVVSSDTIDMVGLIKASQALSSETSLRRLKERVVELLAGLTGATAVAIALRREDSRDWYVSPPGDEDAQPMSVTDAAAAGLLPLSVFRYVERTHEQLLVPDAARDDRFARDPYFALAGQCSLLAIPILSQGEARAVLLLKTGRAATRFRPAGLTP